MKPTIKYTLLIFCVLIFFNLKVNAQEISVIDNKGTISKVINNNVTSGAEPTTPLEGDVWFDTTVTPNVIKIRDGALWRPIVDNNKWSLTGNAGTDPTTNFLGTTDAQDLVLRAGNIEKLRITNDRGQVRINQAPVFNNHPLVIRANGDDVLAFQDASGTPRWHWNLLGSGLNFVESNVADYRLFLENGGNVGVNTNDPTERLDVNGKLRVRDITTVTTDNDLLTVNGTGVVEKKIGSKYENTWLGKDDNLTADKNDTEIYKNGKVGVGDFSSSTIDAQLHVKSTDVPFKIEPNTTTPTGASGGQMFVDNTNGILYIYDGTRNKWLSVDRTMVGWGRNSANTSNEYLRQFNGAQSNNNGWRMIRNGTITAITAQSNINQTWTLEIRKNDATTVITSLTMTATQGNHNNTLNIDVNEGDFIQAFCNGTSIDYPQTLIEIAWRK